MANAVISKLAATYIHFNIVNWLDLKVPGKVANLSRGPCHVQRQP